MKRPRFSVGQIVAILRPAGMGARSRIASAISDLPSRPSIDGSGGYAGLESGQARQFERFDEGHAKLKRLVAAMCLDRVMLQDVLATKWYGPRTGTPPCGIEAPRTRSSNVSPVARSAVQGPVIAIAVVTIPAQKSRADPGESSP